MMKNFLALINCFWVITIPALAQIELGIAGGVNAYKMENIYTHHSGKRLPAFRIGLPVSVMAGKYVKLKTGIFYNRKSSEFKNYQFANQIINRKYVINYWEIDLLLECSIERKSWEVSVFAGPVLGYAINGKYSEGNGVNRLNFQKEGIRTQSLDFTYGFGAGKTFAKSLNIGFEFILFKIGLTSINDNGSAFGKRFSGSEISLRISWRCCYQP